MTMHPTDSILNDYADGALGAAERRTVEIHLAECSNCRELIGDLRELRQMAASLRPLQPPAHLYQRIVRKLRDTTALDAGSLPVHPPASFEPSAVRFRWSWLAAAAVLFLATIVGLRLGPLAPSGPDDVPAESAIAESGDVEKPYVDAIKGLEQIASTERAVLDPGIDATLQQNLAVIDRAIDESRNALRNEPNSEPAQQSLMANFRTKLALLQDTVALINELRKGDDAGVARIVSGT
jgi:anti-sigma factor RsiW